jgi:uncharacterized protein (TIGR02678 family)
MITTYAQDADARRAAARILLTRPILTAERDPENMTLVRRHATALKSMFTSQLGYVLVVEPTYARLVKTVPDPAAPIRPARRPTDGRPLSARGYVHLALVGAALLAPGVGDQVLISTLVDQVRADAADQQITITDSIGDRRHLVTALGLLVDWGVIGETDGSISAWGERRQDEALLTIDRQLLAHLVPSPLHQFDNAEDSLIETTDDQPRRRLRRRMVEHPVVLRADLTDAETDVLSRERTELSRQLYENFGLVLEVRAEGAVAYDPEGQLTDVEFPGSGTLKQAALLLLDALINRLASAPSGSADGGQPDSLLHAPWPVVDAELAGIVERHRRAGWRADYVNNPGLLRDDIVELLASLSLAGPDDGGLGIAAPAARYRPRVLTTRQDTLFAGDFG